MLENIALMNGLTQKMGFLQTRQRVLAQNLTNANTPGYQAMDVDKPDYSKSMGHYMGRLSMVAGQKLPMTTTSSAHMDKKAMMSRPETGDAMRKTYQVTPSKNSVSLEEQMMQSSQNAIEYQLVTNIYNKNTDLLKAAIGR